METVHVLLASLEVLLTLQVPPLVAPLVPQISGQIQVLICLVLTFPASSHLVMREKMVTAFALPDIMKSVPLVIH